MIPDLENIIYKYLHQLNYYECMNDINKLEYKIDYFPVLDHYMCSVFGIFWSYSAIFICGACKEIIYNEYSFKDKPKYMCSC